MLNLPRTQTEELQGKRCGCLTNSCFEALECSREVYGILSALLRRTADMCSCSSCAVLLGSSFLGMTFCMSQLQLATASITRCKPQRL